MRPIIRKSALSSPVRSQVIPEKSLPNTAIKGTVQTASRGLGDTIERVAHATGLDQVAKAYTAVTKKDCGCGKRKEALNRAFPYKQT